jgi:hypothetical protein
LLVRQSAMAPSRIAALARARMVRYRRPVKVPYNDQSVWASIALLSGLPATTMPGNLAFSETSSQLTPPSSGESAANLTFGGESHR